MKRLPFVIVCLLLVIPCQAKQADFTKNGTVDFEDFALLAGAWGSQPGQSNWNSLCDISEPNDNIIDMLDLRLWSQHWIGSEILLEIYSDGWGTLLETITMAEEGEIIISVEEENPYYDPPRYYVYTLKEGYYTELYKCEKDDTITVDLDAVVSDKFNGVIFMTSWFFDDAYLQNTDVNVLIDGNTIVAQFQTDQQGSFAIEPLSQGTYYFEFNVFGDGPEYHLHEVEIQDPYQDFYFSWHVQAYKPNIYIYPEETIQLDVNVVFPHGGLVRTAIPDYNDGWHITAEPSGIIDGQYEFLFYESTQPDYSQYEAGWVVAQEQLESFFRNNMAQTGFNQKEIDDFIEYWIPRLTEYPCYAIYPQYNEELEEMIRLEFSAQPDSLIRLIYSVRGLQNNNLNLQEPVVPSFTREGFTVTEWGIILK